MPGSAHNTRLVIGVTGGIGSGKSAVTAFFEAAGVDVVDADMVSRQVVVPGSAALQQIADHFGAGILQDDGSLDRRALRARIFSDPAGKRWLEALLHPLIRQEIEKQLQAPGSAWVILSSPLLLETDQHKLCDRVLLVDAPEAEQILRTQRRDKTTAEAVEAIMATQLSRRERLQRADDVIVNDRDLGHLQAEVDRLLQFYRELAERPKQEQEQSQR